MAEVLAFLTSPTFIAYSIIVGKTLCAFGDAAATPVLTTLKWFKPEFEAYVKGTQPKPADYRSQSTKPVETH